MIFDHWLTWGPHITELVNKCQKPLNILQTVAHKNWGPDQKTLLNLNCATIRSKHNYGSFLFGTTAESNLVKLDRIQYMAIRLVTGNMRCTVNHALEPEENVMPLKFRKSLIGLQYMSRVYKIQNHITSDIFEKDHLYYYLYENRIKRKAFPLPVEGRLSKLSIKFKLPVNKIELNIKDVNIFHKIRNPIYF